MGEREREREGGKQCVCVCVCVCVCCGWVDMHQPIGMATELSGESRCRVLGAELNNDDVMPGVYSAVILGPSCPLYDH